MKLPLMIGLLAMQAALTGCSMVYKGAGNILVGYAEDHAVPYMLATDDVALGCSMTEAFTPFLLSFSEVTAPPEQLAILLHLMAGDCSEFRAWEEELRYLRAVFAKRPEEAQDARIAQQRWVALAARRQLQGYRYFIRVYGEPGVACPPFESDDDELYWLVGLVSGIQAIMNDIASGGKEGVPLSIAGQVGRGATCLNNEKWWGAPDAIHAAIGLVITNDSEDDRDPLQVLQNALQIGLKQGVYLTQVLAAQVYLGRGEIDKVKDIIRSHAKLSVQTPGNQAFKILNEVAKLQIRAISDRMWTEATGQRTPFGQIGKFWDDSASKVETIDIEDIL